MSILILAIRSLRFAPANGIISTKQEHKQKALSLARTKSFPMKQSSEG